MNSLSQTFDIFYLFIDLLSLLLDIIFMLQIHFPILSDLVLHMFQRMGPL